MKNCRSHDTSSEHSQKRSCAKIGRIEQKLRLGIGLFSVGLGLAELLAPRKTARIAGVPERTTLLRGLGLWEILSGVGILTRLNSNSSTWLKSRVAGDVLDLSLLGLSMRSASTNRKRLSAAVLMVASVTALDILLSQRSDNPTGSGESVRLKKNILILRDPSELYSFWRNLSNLPHVMEHLESVQVLSDGTSHWKAKAPAGMTVEWDAEITTDHPNRFIAWRSTGNADIPNSGSVSFKPSAETGSCEVLVELEYQPPGGRAGAGIAKLFGEDPQQQISADLRRFKQIMETGEVARVDGQPCGKYRSRSGVLNMIGLGY